MKTLSKLVLVAVLLTTAAAANAEWVRGHFRSNGVYVAPYYRTPANGIPYDNLSYRGYPSQQPGYVSPRTYGYGGWRSTPYSITGTTTHYGSTAYHNYQSSYGSTLWGTTTHCGNTAYTTLSGW